MTVGPVPRACAQEQPKHEKKVKDQGEYDLFNAVAKETDPNKKLQLLNTWKEKYPGSDFKEDRLAYYLATYSALNNPSKVLETAKEMVAINPKNLQALGASIAYVFRLNPPSADDLAFAEKAANSLLGSLDELLAPDKKPQGVSDADWKKQRVTLEALAHSALGWIAMQRKDNATAEQQYSKSLEVEPGNGQVSYWLGQIDRGTRTPEKQSAALYHFARAASYDGPGALNEAGRREIQQYLEKAYTQYHGDKSGLNELLAQAKTQSLPPADFKIKTATEIAIEKEEEFKKSNPALALWMGLRKELTGPSGEQFFDEKMKGTLVPGGANNVQKFKGTLLAAKPAVRSKELVVGVADATVPEVTLKLDAPLTGKPEVGKEIEFEGVPQSFTKDPFMVTFDVEKAKVSGLKVESVAPARRPAARKAGTRKKG